MFKKLKEKLFKKSYDEGYLKGYSDRSGEILKTKVSAMKNENLRYLKVVYPDWIRVVLIVNNCLEITIKSFPRTDDYYAHLQAEELIEMLNEYHNLDYEQTRCD